MVSEFAEARRRRADPGNVSRVGTIHRESESEGSRLLGEEPPGPDHGFTAGSLA